MMIIKKSLPYFYLLASLVLSINMAQAQYLVVKKSAKIRTVPSLNGNIIEKVPKGTTLIMVEEAKASNNNYYKVKCTTVDREGWLVMTAVKKVNEELPDEVFSEYTYATNVFNVGQIPAGYYDAAKGINGDSLKMILHRIIRNHRPFSYDEVYKILEATDQDPYDTLNVVLLYTGRSVNRRHKDHGGRYNYKQNGYIYQDSWNREHVWPKSFGFPNEVDTAYTDVHHIRPADRIINTDRNTRSFGYGTIPYFDNDGAVKTECFTSEEWLWEPPDFVKGDIARMVFYMAVRYEGYEYNGEKVMDLEIVEGIHPKGSKDPKLGSLSILLEWHQRDPVDNWERRRNDIIYSKYQGNRNPFVDHPEYVEKIWQKR